MAHHTATQNGLGAAGRGAAPQGGGGVVRVRSCLTFESGPESRMLALRLGPGPGLGLGLGLRLRLGPG